MKPGDRVGAILGEKDGKVEFLGYGVYDGEKIPEDAVGGIAQMVKEAGMANPCIKLDSGKIVWGCECWWGSEAEIQRQLEPRRAAGEVVDVDIDEVRKEFTESLN